MSLLQKWMMGLLGLGAGYMVIMNPDAFYKGAKGIESLTAGSVVAVTTGGKGKATF
jgi:hypothetical protein